VTPNPQQSAVIRFATHGLGSCNVIARAGCGKTSLLVSMAEEITRWNPRLRLFLGAFNTAIAEELRGRIPYRSVTVKTMHAIGLQCFRFINPRFDVNGHKVSSLAKQRHQFDKKSSGVVTAAVGYAKQMGLGLPYDGLNTIDDPAIWREIFDAYELTDEIPADKSDEAIIESCIVVYRQSIEMCKREVAQIDFDDMILAPLLLASNEDQFRQFDWVMIDELQDQNHIRRVLAARLLRYGGRFCGVGDDRQCQPRGTMVTLEGKKTIPIEDVKVGDRLISFDQNGHQFCGTTTQGRKVLETAHRFYEGRLILIDTENGCTTQVTPNHKFFCKWSTRGTGCNVTYLMRKGPHFRLGWCQLFQAGGIFHLGMRARLEDADDAWIVAVHETKEEASMYESILSTKYQIPLPQFKEHANAGHYTQAFLDRFWCSIGKDVDLLCNATRLLKAHGRMIEYPFYSKSTYRRHGRTTCFTTQACNMISGMMSVPVFEGTKKQVWSEITLVDVPYSGEVYSLDVETHHNYIADGIVTKNSIYRFAGADSDSMERTKKHMNIPDEHVFPLNVTYRCPKSVVRLAQTWVPDFTAHENNPEGTVATIHHSEFWKQDFDRVNDVILCRNRRPLVGISKRLRKMGIQCVVEGGNGKGLIALAEKWGDDITIEQLSTHLDEYRSVEVSKHLAKGREDKAEAVHERVDILMDLMDGLQEDDSVAELVRRIEITFDNSGKSDLLKLCTVHRSKGREWRRVFLIGRNRYMPSYYAVRAAEAGHEEALKQEENLEYVAVTRAKEELVEMWVPDKKARKNGEEAEEEWWEL